MTPSPPDELRTCLLHLGAALLGCGLPVQEVEAEVARAGHALGAPDVTVAGTLTGLFVGVADDGMGYRAAVEQLRLDQTGRVHDLLDRVQDGSATSTDALAELDGILAGPAPRPAWIGDLGMVPIAVGICLILQPTWLDVAVAAVGGLIVAVLAMLARHSPLLRTLLPVIAALAVGCLVLGAAQWWPLTGTLRTAVAALAVLLPGSMLVTGMSEIASGSAVAGTSRLVTGTVQLVLFAVGIYAAVAVLGLDVAALTNVRSDSLGGWAPWAGLLVVAVGVVLNVAPAPSAIPGILVTLTLTFLVQSTVQRYGGVALGGLAGATVAALSAAVVGRLTNPALTPVVYLPAFWLLVPGSFGLLGTAEVASGVGGVAELAGIVTSVVGVALGTMIGSAAGRSLSSSYRS